MLVVIFVFQTVKEKRINDETGLGITKKNHCDGDIFEHSVKLEALQTMLRYISITEISCRHFKPCGMATLPNIYLLYIVSFRCSSLSQYVHNVDATKLSDEERQHIDHTIDQLYDEIEKGIM